jgi:hypothetical protein
VVADECGLNELLLDELAEEDRDGVPPAERARQLDPTAFELPGELALAQPVGVDAGVLQGAEGR